MIPWGRPLATRWRAAVRVSDTRTYHCHVYATTEAVARFRVLDNARANGYHRVVLSDIKSCELMN